MQPKAFTFPFLSAGFNDVHSQRTSLWLCNWTVMTLHCPHWTGPNSTQSVLISSSGTVTWAHKRMQICGPPIILNNGDKKRFKNCALSRNIFHPKEPTLIGTTASTEPIARLAPLGSKVTLKSTVSWSGAPGSCLTLSSSTVKPGKECTIVKTARKLCIM